MDTADLLDLLERDVSDEAFDSHDDWDHIREAQRRAERSIFDRALIWTREPAPLLRHLGMAVLGQLGCPGARPYQAETEPVLMALLEDEDPEVAESALHALGFQESGDEEVIAGLATHPDRRVRYGVAACFNRRQGDVPLRTLLGLMEDEDDEDDEVRDWATYGVGAQREDDTPEIREALFARLDDPDEATKWESVSGLARRGDRRVLALVREGLRAEDPGPLDLEPAAVWPGGKFLPDLERLAAEHPDDPRYAESVKRCRTHLELADH